MSNLSIYIKELPKEGNFNLEEYGKSKLPGTFEGFQIGKNRDGRYKTGFDEESYLVKTIPNSEKREKVYNKLKNIRLELERALGKDLSGLSDFYKDYLGFVDTTRPLDLTNPVDKLTYLLLKANDVVLDNIKNAHDIRYINTKYVFHRENASVEEEVLLERKLQKALFKLEEMIDTEFDTLIDVCRYLKLKVNSSMPKANVYKIVNTYLKNYKVNDSVDTFLDTVNLPLEQIAIKITILEAIEKKVITVSRGLYQRGNITYGENENEVVQFLSSSENSGEFMSLKSELDMKKKYA